MDRKLLEALIDCASVMERDLSGLALIQPELERAKIAIADATSEPAAWTGEGLPPVGTMCEFSGFNTEETVPSDPFIGDQVTVIAHFMSGSIEVAAFTFYAPPDFDFLQVGQGAYGCFRPIRTPEQIAAEDRKRACEDLQKAVSSSPNCKAHGIPWDVAEAIYDAGYRKQVTE